MGLKINLFMKKKENRGKNSSFFIKILRFIMKLLGRVLEKVIVYILVILIILIILYNINRNMFLILFGF